jgi:hypothetical protein
MMRFAALLLACGLPALLVGGVAAAARAQCADDAVEIGTACVDKYEASLWRLAPGSEKLVAKIRRGRISLAALEASGASQIGAVPDSCLDVDFGAGFPPTGNWTEPLYAVSVPGVLPTSCVTWFQAATACRLSGKRLVSNAEWQAAALGTPDPGEADDLATTCATFTDHGVPAGSRSACVSIAGTHDMVGNVWELTADWQPLASGCIQWGPEMGNDISCVGVTDAPIDPVGFRGKWRGLLQQVGVRLFRVESLEPVPGMPSSVIRGGNFAIGERAGVYAIYAGIPPNVQSRSTGFRCAR